MIDSIILRTDAYKHTHWKQYPPDTKRVYSYLESRGGKFDDTVFFGLQALLMRHFEGQVVTDADVLAADRMCQRVFGEHGSKYLNVDGWYHIIDEHGGKLPVEIRAVPEGSLVPTGVPMMTVVNTDEKVPFITNFIESHLLHVWYPCTVATLSYHIRMNMQYYASRMREDVSPVMLNDFGFRGVSSLESAGMGGMAHLLSFIGTDNIYAMDYARRYYGGDVVGVSVPAAEHSTVTSWGQGNEQMAYFNIMKAYPDNAMVSIVCDSYDTINAVEHIFGDILYETVTHRDGGVIILRPDSGNPPVMLAHVLAILARKFGFTVNDAGYKVLYPHVRVIYGDGINYESIDEILRSVCVEGKWAMQNFVFGMGGALLQQVNRDTQRFAFKCSAVQRNSAWAGVCKNPITDLGKRSKAGLVGAGHNDDGWYCTSHDDEKHMPVVFRDGSVTSIQSFDDIKKNLWG